MMVVSKEKKTLVAANLLEIHYSDSGKGQQVLEEVHILKTGEG